MIRLGSPVSAFFGPTPYEQALKAFESRTGIHLREVFEPVAKTHGNNMDAMPLIYEIDKLTDSAFSQFLDETILGRGIISTNEEETIAGVFTEMTWFNYQHFAGGEKVFRIHENLGKALNATDLRVPSAYLNLPYEGMCLSFEGTVAEVPGEQGSGIISSAYLVSRSIQQEIVLGPNPRLIVFYSKKPEGDYGPGLTAQVKSLGKNIEIVDEEFVLRNIETGPEDPRGQLVLLALKTIAYINSAGADAIEEQSQTERIEAILADPIHAPPGEERRKLKKKLNRVSRLPFIYIGSRLPIPKEEAVTITEGGVRKITHRFMVRGHFHGFWKLEKNLREDEKSWIQERDGDWVLVLKWLHPYEKGPTEAEKIHRRYFVSGS